MRKRNIRLRQDMNWAADNLSLNTQKYPLELLIVLCKQSIFRSSTSSNSVKLLIAKILDGLIGLEDMLIDSQFKVGVLNKLGSLNTSMTRNSPCYPSLAMEGFFRAASSPGVCYLSRREALPTRIFWVTWGIFFCMRGAPLHSVGMSFTGVRHTLRLWSHWDLLLVRPAGLGGQAGHHHHPALVKAH